MIKKTVDTEIGEQRVVLQGVSWDMYVALNDEIESPGCRMTYDCGLLEIMNTSMAHETGGRILGRMVEQFTLVRNVEIKSVKSTTFRRKDLQKGFEGDETYYIQNAARMRGRAKVDLLIDPPPDLVIEIEITHSAIDKLALFAKLGIPEIWRYNEKRLWTGTLVDGQYEAIEASIQLPEFPFGLATDLLSRRVDSNETELIHEFVKRMR